MTCRLNILMIVLGAALLATPAVAKPGDAEAGKATYLKRCVFCHGAEGDGNGPAAERLNPPPRDFTQAQYKFKTTAFDDMVPNDDDLMRMVRDGMPGTAMPGWKSLLSEQQMWDVIAYIKTFASLEKEAPTKQVDYGSQISPSADSIAKGKTLFEDRCVECHGLAGKGVAVKKLNDDSRHRTWPRNFTKSWTFRASNDPRDIFTRMSIGIPGTQMPSFADPASNKKLSVEERWHVANYVASLAQPAKAVRPENTVVKARRAEAAIPESPDDPVWEQSIPTTFFLVPQIIAKERFFKPSNDTITVRAAYDDKEIALLLEWDDRTKSIVGDEEAAKISDPVMGPDSVAVQLPVAVPEGMEKPYFGMGDAQHPVNIWQWKSAPAGGQDSVTQLDSRGFADIKRRDASEVKAVASYREGTWRVLMRRPLQTGSPEFDHQFAEGRLTPIAFAAWDGSNSESGSRHTMTTWYWLQLAPPRSHVPYAVAFMVMLLVAGVEWLWAASVAKRRREANA